MEKVTEINLPQTCLAYFHRCYQPHQSANSLLVYLNIVSGDLGLGTGALESSEFLKDPKQQKQSKRVGN